MARGCDTLRGARLAGACGESGTGGRQGAIVGGEVLVSIRRRVGDPPPEPARTAGDDGSPPRQRHQLLVEAGDGLGERLGVVDDLALLIDPLLEPLGREAVGAGAGGAGAGPRALGSMPLAFLWQPVTAPMEMRVAAITKVLRIPACIAFI